MTKAHIWLRAESKPLEERIALTPDVAKLLLAAGFKVTVEDSPLSAIPALAYQEVGCDIVPAHSWRSAPSDTIILGLKELSEDNWPLVHRHIHFAHVYKEQQGWKDVLRRFQLGKGELYDLEYLVDHKQRRVAAFGYWAGFAGAAVALKAFGLRQLGSQPMLPKLMSMPSKQALVDDVANALSPLPSKPKVLVDDVANALSPLPSKPKVLVDDAANALSPQPSKPKVLVDDVANALSPLSSKPKVLVDDVASALSSLSSKPKVLVIGAKGRSGRGAVEMAKSVGADVTEWDMAETQAGGPFEDILNFDVLINCVFVQAALPPFITLPMLTTNEIEPRRLAIICDVSCDPYGTYNPLPIYTQCTTFDEPCIRILEGNNPLDLIAIDHLPSLLPVESSEDFCQQLLPHLLQLDDLNQGVWQRASQVFTDKVSQL